MDTDRINQLKKFIEEDPSDPFPKYALALEYQTQNPELAKSLFLELLQDFPEYMATYYHAAGFFSESGETGRARAIYEKGIELLSGSRDIKALSELQNAYQNFLIETEA